MTMRTPTTRAATNAALHRTSTPSMGSTAASYRASPTFNEDRERATATLGRVEKVEDLDKTFGIKGYYVDTDGCPRAPWHFPNLINILCLISFLGRKDSDLFFKTYGNIIRPTRKAIIDYMKKNCFIKDDKINDSKIEDAANALFDLCLHTSEKQVTFRFFGANSYLTGSIAKIINLIQTEVVRLREFPDIINDTAANGQKQRPTEQFLSTNIFTLNEWIAYFDHTKSMNTRDQSKITTLINDINNPPMGRAAATHSTRQQLDEASSSPSKPLPTQSIALTPPTINLKQDVSQQMTTNPLEQKEIASAAINRIVDVYLHSYPQEAIRIGYTVISLLDLIEQQFANDSKMLVKLPNITLVIPNLWNTLVAKIQALEKLCYAVKANRSAESTNLRQRLTDASNTTPAQQRSRASSTATVATPMAPGNPQLEEDWEDFSLRILGSAHQSAIRK